MFFSRRVHLTIDFPERSIRPGDCIKRDAQALRTRRIFIPPIAAAVPSHLYGDTLRVLPEQNHPLAAALATRPGFPPYPGLVLIMGVTGEALPYYRKWPEAIRGFNSRHVH